MFLFLQEVYVENYYHINWPVYCTYQNCNFSGEWIIELIWIGIESEEYICKIKFTSKGFFLGKYSGIIMGHTHTQSLHW